jgi:hypothetical protein
MILFLIPFHGLRLESISQTLHYWASTLDDAHEDHDHCYDQQYVDQSAQGVELTIPSSQRINSKATIVQSIRKPSLSHRRNYPRSRYLEPTQDRKEGESSEGLI